jgi:hypothetical protein
MTPWSLYLPLLFWPLHSREFSILGVTQLLRVLSGMLHFTLHSIATKWHNYYVYSQYLNLPASHISYAVTPHHLPVKSAEPCRVKLQDLQHWDTHHHQRTAQRCSPFHRDLDQPQNLEHFWVAQKLNQHQVRWLLYLSRFDFMLHHKAGRSMGKLDTLSRQADHVTGQGDNDNLTLLSLELLWIHALSGTRLEGDEQKILQEVQCSLRDDTQEESVVKAARELQKDKGWGMVKSAKQSESERLLMFRDKTYVTKDRDLSHRIMEQHHDIHITWHADHFKTIKMVSQHYWWPQTSQYIGIYVKTCDLCSWTKLQHHQTLGELHPSETPEAWWNIVSVNFIIELQELHGYDAIINIVDSVRKRVHFIPTHTMINAEGATWLYLWEVWKHHGLPQAVLSRLLVFTHKLYQLLGIKLATLTITPTDQ